MEIEFLMLEVGGKKNPPDCIGRIASIDI